VISGSCLCRDVAFEIDESGIVMSNNCFCTSCRKVSGAGYGTFLQLKPSCFRWTSDPSKVATYESSPGIHRAFVGGAGRGRRRGASCGGRAGRALDSDPGVRPEVALYAESMAPWCVADVTGRAYAQAPRPEFLDEFMSRLR
jgi:hypothetical protein